MSWLAFWLIGALIAAIAGCGVIGLARRPVSWRTVNWTLAAAVLWPAVLIGGVIASLIVTCGIVREVLAGDFSDGGVW